MSKLKKIEARVARFKELRAARMKELRAARIEELRSTLWETKCINEQFEDIYWLIEDREDNPIDDTCYPTEYDAFLACESRLYDELHYDEEFMAEANKIENEEERHEFVLKAAERGVNEVYHPAPYCEIDGIECCLVGTDIPEELLK